MICKEKIVRIGKYVFTLIVLVCFVILFIRNYIEMTEQKRSVILRTGTDEDIRMISKTIRMQEMSVIRDFSWNQLNMNRLFVSKYAYYCRCISVAIASSVNRDQRIIPYLKEAIQQFVESPNMAYSSLFDIYVWSLLYIEGKPTFTWLEKKFNSNLYFPLELKNRIMSNARYMLWIGEDGDDIFVPDFVKNIQINIYDKDWTIRFYREYCRFYKVYHLRDFDDWCRHFQQQKNVISTSSYEEDMFLESWYILYNTIKNNSPSSIISTSRNIVSLPATAL
jgi:hypothetical protein